MKIIWQLKSRSGIILDNIENTSSLSNDSRSITWHQWQVEYPTDKKIILFFSLAALNASSPQGYQWTGFEACCRRYGDRSSFNLFPDEDEEVDVDAIFRFWIEILQLFRKVLFLHKVGDISDKFAVWRFLEMVAVVEFVKQVLFLQINFLSLLCNVWSLNSSKLVFRSLKSSR